MERVCLKAPRCDIYRKGTIAGRGVQPKATVLRINKGELPLKALRT